MRIETLEGSVIEVDDATGQDLIARRKAQLAPPPEPKRRSFRGTPLTIEAPGDDRWEDSDQLANRLMVETRRRRA